MSAGALLRPVTMVPMKKLRPVCLTPTSFLKLVHLQAIFLPDHLPSLCFLLFLFIPPPPPP